MRANFPKHKVVCPFNCEVAVLRGALEYVLNPCAIKSRIAAATLGVQTTEVYNSFHAAVRAFLPRRQMLMDRFAEQTSAKAFVSWKRQENSVRRTRVHKNRGNWRIDCTR